MVLTAGVVTMMMVGDNGGPVVVMMVMSGGSGEALTDLTSQGTFAGVNQNLNSCVPEFVGISQVLED